MAASWSRPQFVKKKDKLCKKGIIDMWAYEELYPKFLWGFITIN